MRRRKNSWLFEGKDDAGAEEVEFDDAGFDEEEGDVDVDAIKSAVEDLAAAVGMEASDSDEDMDDDMDMEDVDDLVDDDLDFEDDDLEESYMAESDESDELDKCECDE